MSQTLSDLMAPPPVPSAVEAETALLGIVLMDNDAMKRIGDVLAPESFYEPYHQRLWAMACDLISQGRLAEPTSLAERLRADDLFQTFGGLRYLADLVHHAPLQATAPDYARRIHDSAQRRMLIEIAAQAGQSARDMEREPFGIIADTDAALSALMTASAPDGHTLIDAQAAALELVAELDHEAATGFSPGIMTGLDCIDVRLQGLYPNELIILGGRPSMGKTSLARAIAMATARRNPDVLVPFFCLEMDRRQISRRNLSAFSYEAGVRLQYRSMKRGRDLPAEDRAHLQQMGRQVPTNFVLDDTAVLTLDHIRRRLMSLSRKGRIGLVVIDYLQIMDMPGIGYGLNMTTALGQITKGLKQLAKQLSCTILLLSQLSRKVEERDNKRPMLSDLRESGSIEQDASSVLFTYREAYYLEREGPKKGETVQDHELALHGCMRTMEVICAKSREGPIGTTRQTYIAECDVVMNEDRAYG